MDNQGEQSLNPNELQELVPDLVSSKGQQLVNTMLSKANKVKPELDNQFKLIAAQNGLDPNVDFESRVKNPDTVVKKVAVHRQAGKDGYRVNNVNDLYGARFIADTPNQKQRIMDALQDLHSNNWMKIDKQEQVDHGTYHANHVDFNKDGVKGEIQIHDPHSLFESVINHEIRAKYGEKPPAQLEAQKQANMTLGYKMPADSIQRMAQIIQAGRVLQGQKGGVNNAAS